MLIIKNKPVSKKSNQFQKNKPVSKTKITYKWYILWIVPELFYNDSTFLVSLCNFFISKDNLFGEML